MTKTKTKISKADIKKLVEVHIRRYLSEQQQASKQSAGHAPAGEVTQQDVKDNVQALGLISQKMMKLHPKQKEAAMLELSRHFANEAEDNVGMLPDKVVETLMFLDTEPQKSIVFAVKNVPSSVLFGWLNSYKKVFDLISRSKSYNKTDHLNDSIE